MTSYQHLSKPSRGFRHVDVLAVLESYDVPWQVNAVGPMLITQCKYGRF